MLVKSSAIVKSGCLRIVTLDWPLDWLYYPDQDWAGVASSRALYCSEVFLNATPVIESRECAPEIIGASQSSRPTKQLKNILPYCFICPTQAYSFHTNSQISNPESNPLTRPKSFVTGPLVTAPKTLTDVSVQKRILYDQQTWKTMSRLRLFQLMHGQIPQIEMLGMLLTQLPFLQML